MDGKLRNMTSLYLTKGDSVLCLYRIGSRVANQMYIGSAGGHFESDELNDARKCVLREAYEELGIREEELVDLKMRYITLRLKNGEVRQNYYFFARLREDRELISTEGQLHWVNFEDIPALKMPSSAKHMILHYLKQGRFDDTIYAGVSEHWGANFAPLGEFDD
jgi:8-oxo-dGTP diphosphatase